MGFLRGGGFVVALILVSVCIITAIEPRFLSRLNLLNVGRNAAYLAVVAIGQMFVMITGGFDLAIGAVIAASSIVTAMMMTGPILHGMATGPLIGMSIATGLAAGGVIGMVSGICTAALRLNPLMVTLAMTSMVSGATLYVTKGIPIYGMPNAFIEQVGRGYLWGLPTIIVIAMVVVLVGLVFQRRTPVGRHIYAIGGNLVSARLSGIGVGRLLVLVYAVSGMLAALTGILLTARIGSGQSSLDNSVVIESIAASVIGGVSLQGGTGRIERVALAALFISIVSNGLNLTRVESKYQIMVVGVVLIAAVVVDRLLSSRRADA